MDRPQSLYEISGEQRHVLNNLSGCAVGSYRGIEAGRGQRLWVMEVVVGTGLGPDSQEAGRRRRFGIDGAGC
jgi:hypothetical protein